MIETLSIRRISRNTVKRILKEHGLDTGPKRGTGTWDDFVRRHAVSLWQCDFFSQRIVTLTGVRHAFVLVFIHIKTRQIVISPATLHPNEVWVVEQSEGFIKKAPWPWCESANRAA